MSTTSLGPRINAHPPAQAAHGPTPPTAPKTREQVELERISTEVAAGRQYGLGASVTDASIRLEWAGQSRAWSDLNRLNSRVYSDRKLSPGEQQELASLLARAAAVPYPSDPAQQIPANRTNNYGGYGPPTMKQRVSWVLRTGLSWGTMVGLNAGALTFLHDGDLLNTAGRAVLLGFAQGVAWKMAGKRESSTGYPDLDV
jgi:hypothetical protein